MRYAYKVWDFCRRTPQFGGIAELNVKSAELRDGHGFSSSLMNELIPGRFFRGIELY